MASEKLTQLDLVTSLNSGDLFYVVQDVGTIPTSFRVQFSDIASSISAASLTVEEEDGVPTVNNVNTIKVSNGTLTNHGGGVVSIVNSVSEACPSPLTNGDPTTPALVFSPAGDVIMVGC